MQSHILWIQIDESVYSKYNNLIAMCFCSIHRIFLWTKNKMLPQMDWHRDHRHIEIGKWHRHPLHPHCATCHQALNLCVFIYFSFAGELSKARPVNRCRLVPFPAHTHIKYLNRRRSLQNTIQIFHFEKQVRNMCYFRIRMVHAILSVVCIYSEFSRDIIINCVCRIVAIFFHNKWVKINEKKKKIANTNLALVQLLQNGTKTSFVFRSKINDFRSVFVAFCFLLKKKN